jgi:prepilin-type N-terminal cleavage/methylation domain-containing protein
MRCARESGVTLVELIVVLAILGLVLGISGVALASLREPARSAEMQQLARARAEAIQSGAAVARDSVLFLPDGRAIGGNADYLTGVPHAR